MMIRKKLLLGGATLVCLTLSFDAVTYSSGAPSGRTGSPSSIGTCSTGGCHSGPSVTSEIVSITTDIPAAGFQPNTNYSIMITADDGGRGLTKMGFEASIEDASGHVGIVSPVNANVKKVINSEFVTHTSSGNSAAGGMKTWTFNWNSGNAPDQSIVYAAVNFANGNGSVTGDVIVTHQLVLNKAQNVALEEYQAPDLSVFPNPATDYIKINEPESFGGDIFVMELTGKRVMTIAKKDQFDPVDISNLSPGHYILTDAKGKQSSQLIVQ